MRSVLFVLKYLLPCLLGVFHLAPPPAHAVEPEVFGHGVMTVNDVLPRGPRPLLVVLMDFDDVRFDADHTRAYYEDFFVGPGFPNVRDFFREQSGGRFTWEPRVVGPIRHPDDPGTSEDEGLLNCAVFRTLPGPDGEKGTGDDIGGCPSHPSAADPYYDRSWESILTTVIEEAARQAGVRFATYDRDDDGKVGADELVVIMVGSKPVDGRFRESGATRRAVPNSCVDIPGQDVEVCTSFSAVRGRGAAMSSFGEAVDFDTVVHELAHTLGTLDLYGARSRMNGRLTIMGPTLGGPEDERRTYHLDPWHKMALGWITPRIVKIPEITQENACRHLRGARGELSIEERGGRPVLIYDPANGTDEFYLLEGRNPEGYDEDVRGRTPGVGLWYIQLASDRLPRRFDSLIQPGANGTLDSGRRGDDVPNGKFILPGPDGRLQSRRSGDDKTADDVMLFHVGSTSTTADPTLYGVRGTGGLWAPASGIADPRWFGADSPAFSMRMVDMPSVPPWSITVDLAARRMAFAPVRDALTARSGDSLTLSGHFGGRASRTLTISPVDGGSTERLEVRSWRCGEIDATLPRLEPGRYEIRVRDSALGIVSDPQLISIGGTADWTGVYAGRLDGRRARLTIERGSGDIPTYGVVLEDLQRGISFRGSVPVRSGEQWYAYENVRLRQRGGDRTQTLEALYLDTREGQHVTGWSLWHGNDYGVAFREGGLPRRRAGGLEGDSPSVWQQQWAGTYRGEFDGDDVELTLSPEESSALGATFAVRLHYLASGKTFTGTGAVLANQARTLRFGRSLKTEHGSDTVRLTRMLLHTWNTAYITGFGKDPDGQFVGGYFAISSR